MKPSRNPIRRSSSLLLLSIAFSLFVLSSFNFLGNKEKEEISIRNPHDYRIVSPDIPETITFAGEIPPLGEFDVRERLDREIIINTYWHSSTLINLKKANRWFPVIEKILAEKGIPNDFKYLALIESGLTNAISPAGATGFWQFLKSTGKKYGLEINSVVDERYHVEKSTVAACEYLKEAYERFGSWTMAAASYNMGMNGVESQIEKQRSDNYYDLALNEETSRYVFRILAAKAIYENQNDYGFYLEDKDLYQPHIYRVIQIDSKIDDLASFAFEQGVNYKQLKLLNPWLRNNYLTNSSKKVYNIKIPLTRAD